MSFLGKTHVLRRVLIVAIPLIGSLGVGTAVFSAMNAAAPSCDGLAATVVGTSGDDVLNGTAGRDVVVALDGEDVVRGLGGADVLCGGGGADTMHGGDGNDLVLGGGADDVLTGGDGADRVAGQGGADRLRGDDGHDHLWGGAGPDVVAGNIGEDLGVGGSGDDDLLGGDGQDVLWGGDGDDKASGGTARDMCGAEALESCNEQPDNEAPTTVENFFSVPEDTELTRTAPGVLGNDTDPEGDALRAIRETAAGHGAARLYRSGLLEYMPDTDFHGTDKFTYRASDGLRQGREVTVTVTVRSVNDPITAVTLDGNSVAENLPAGTVVGSLSAADVDAGDEHTFALVSGTGSADNGRFLIDGDQLRTADTFDAETEGPLSILVQATDTAGATHESVFGIAVTNVNEAPALTPSAGSTAFTEDAAAAAVDAGLTVADVDDTNFEGGRARISDGMQSGDDLSFADQNGISGAYNTATGVLTLTGTASAADYQTALRAIKFRSTSQTPGASRTVAFDVSDGDLDADTVSKTIAVTAVNDAPTNTVPTAATVAEDGARTFSAANNNGLSLTDVDAADDPVQASVAVDHGSVTLADTTGLTFTVGDGTADATQTFSGTLSALNSALDGLTYNPNADHAGADALTLTTDDQGNNGSGGPQTDTDAVALTVEAANDAPTVTTTTGSTPFTEDGSATPIDVGLIAADADDANLESGQVRIFDGLQSGDDLIFVDQNGITGSYNTVTGVLTLTGTASRADYQAALRSVAFDTTNQTPSASRSVQFKVNDGDVDSSVATKTVAVTAVNDAPEVNLTNTDLGYVEGDGAKAIDSSITLTDVESDQLSGAIVDVDDADWVAAQDELAFDDSNTTDGITLGSTSDTTGTLALTGQASLAAYEAALEGVSYTNSSDNPDTTPRTLSLTVTDVPGATSAVDSRDIAISGVNDAPAATTSTGSTSYTQTGSAATVDSTLTVTDADDTNLDSGQVRISGGFQSGDDLVYVNQNGITGSYNTGTGVLTLTGAATTADYQTALRSIQFQTASGDPSATKTIAFKVNDGDLDSNTATKAVAVTGANDAPVNTVPGAQTMTEDGARVFSAANDSAISVADVDAADDDMRVDLNVDNGSVTLDGTTGLTFTTGDGTADARQTFTGTLSAINAALDGLAYNPSANFNGSDTLTLTTDDQGNNGSGGALTDTDAVTITVTAANDAPVLSLPDAQTVNEDATHTFSTGTGRAISVADTDAGGSDVQMTLAVEHGTLDLGGVSGLTFTTGDGTDDASMQFAGTVAEINAALNGLAYTPDANYNGAETLSAAVNDGGNTGSGGALTDTDTVAITLTAVNDAPVNTVPGAQTVAEDGAKTFSAANSNRLSVADVDAAGDAVKATLDVDHGTLTLGGTTGLMFTTGDGTADPTVVFTGTLSAVNTAVDGLIYNPTANYAAGDTLTFTTDDQGGNGSGGTLSDSDTVAITVTGANDAPTAVDNAVTTNEDTPTTLTAPGVLANDNDVDGDPLTAVKVTDPTLGVVTLGSDGSFTYTPNANAHGTDSFTYKANDGSADSNIATVTITVTPVNDAPVAGDDGPYQALQDQNFTLTQPGVLADDSDVEGGALAAGNASDPANGTVTLNPDGSFSYTPDNGYVGPDSFTYDVSDGAATDTATVTINVVPPNATPTADATSASGNEDGGAITVTLTGHDADGDGLTFDAGTATSGLVTVPANTSCDANVPSVCTATVTYTPGANFNGSDSFTYTVNDSTIDSAAATASITVNSVNDEPSFTKGADQALDEDAGAQTVTGWATNVSVGPANESAQNATFNATTSNDALFSALPTVTSGGTLSYTPAADGNGSATVTISVSDDGGTANGGDDTSGSQTFTITVDAVNDTPSFTKGADQTLNEDAGAQSVSNWATAISKGPANESAQTLSFTTSNDNNALFAVQPGVTPTGTLVYTSASNAYGSATVTISLSDTGGTANGGDDTSDAQTFTITVNPVNDAPVADDETFNGANTAIGNTAMIVNDPDDGAPSLTTPKKAITGDILAGDTDVESPLADLTVTPGTFATNDGGDVTIESDGDFTFHPAVATSCTDTSDFFDYTVEDNDGGLEQTDTGRVTIAIAGCVWYVNNFSPGNSGSSHRPFDTLAQAETASGANHTVFVYEGDPNNVGLGYSGDGYQMDTGERLIGEREGLTVDPDQGGTLAAESLHPASPGAHPTISASNADAVSLDDANEIRGFNIDPDGTGGGIAGGSGDTGGATIDDVNIIDTDATAGQQPGLELNATTGTFNLTNLVVNNKTHGVLLANAGTAEFAGTTSRISLTTAGGPAFTATNTNLGTSSIDDITVTGSGTGGISMISIPTSSSVTFGDGTGTDLDLQTTSGSTPAFDANNGGTIVVPAAGTANVRATGGPAVSIVSTPNAQLDLDDVDSTGSASDGIRLNTSGPFSASTGDITGAGSASVKVAGGNSAVTYPGALGNGPGTVAIDITGRTGGVVTLAGPISDTNDVGGILNVVGNTGGSTVLSNATKQFNAGSMTAVTFNNSDGHTLTLSGGGLDIDTTSGQGLAATTSGTIEVSGAGNTLDAASLSGTNRGLNISDTDIAASDVTFQRVRSIGGANGIRLSNTGTAGNLNVTGIGGTCTNASTAGCSGGEIANTTGADSTSTTPDGAGIVLNNTVAPSFIRMWIHDHSNYGIRGASVNGLGLVDSVVNGVNGTNATGGIIDSSVLFDTASGPGLVGVANVTDTHISGGFTNNFAVHNESGALNRLTFTRVTIGANSATDGNDGVIVEGLGSATTNVTVANSTFTSARGDLFQMIGDGSGGSDLEFTSNTLSNNHPGIATGGGGVSIFGGGGNALFDADITGANTFRDAVGHALLLVKSAGAGDMNATVSGAAVGVAGVANSGSKEGAGIKFQHAGGNPGDDATITITNSQIREYNNEGILLQAGAGIAAAGGFNNTITNNTIANPGTNLGGIFQGINLNSGVTPGDSFATCAHIAQNTVSGAGRNGGTDMRARARMVTAVRLPGYALSPTDGSQVSTFLSAQNSAAQVSAAVDAGNAGFGGGPTPCAQ